MEWNTVGTILRDLGLPALGTALGGPAGGIFGKAIAEALGAPATPQGVQEALTAGDPETIRNQLADIDSARRADIDMAKIEAESSASARLMQQVAMEQHSSQEMTPTILAYLNFGLFSAVLMSLIAFAWWRPVIDFPAGVKEIIVFLLGHLSAGLKDSQAFFFGTSRSSERNGAAVRAIATNSNIPSPAQLIGQVATQAIRKA